MDVVAAIHAGDVRIDDVVEVILARPAEAGVRLVAVDGPAASGKSTLARALANSLRAPIIATDEFLSWADMSGWWPRLEEQVLQPLFAGCEARYQVRDWAGDEFGSSYREWKSLPWAPVVILEGLTSARQAATGRLAYAVFVDAPREVRLARGVARDGESHRLLWRRWQDEEDAWFASDNTRSRCGLIVTTEPR